MDNVRSVLILSGACYELVEEMFLSEGWAITDDLNDADLVQFIGGEDVSPSLYDQHIHPKTHCNLNRDNEERTMYLQALEQGIAMAGICRGGQFLNVMNGGSLYQDCDNHGLSGTHKAWLAGAVLPVDVTSTHHQMMLPNHTVDYTLLMTAHQSKRKSIMSNLALNKYESVIHPPFDHATDVEALWYRDTNCLCFQPHPEFNSIVSDTREIYFTFLDRYLFDNIEENLREEA